MEDYTKYRLKSRENLLPYLEKADGIFVLACNKCFKEFTSVEETDGDRFALLAEEMKKKVTGIEKIDFLCNKNHTEKLLKKSIPEGTECFFVVSCGLGVQILTELSDLPVYAAADSLNYRAFHGMALTEKKCAACAQCYLNLTGGICPVVDCSKGLLNGQCGGAKNGKCEVDSSRDCAWEKINRRLKEQNRTEEFENCPVQLRDYSKVNYKFIREYVREIREKRLDGFYGGLRPPEKKFITEKASTVRFPEPETVVIPLSMHSGKIADPIVKINDPVKVGQKIGEASGMVSAPVHSSVSGTVVAVEPRLHPVKGEEDLCVVIRSDGKNTIHESVRPHKNLEELTPDEIAEIVRESGITGMGGAGFPSAVKLQSGKPVDMVLLNGCECEPLLTADHRVMLEFPDEVLHGLRAIMKAVGAPKGCVVIEDNKPDAVELMTLKTKAYDNIEIIKVATKYPQGAEKMLIRRVTGRQVPRGGLPVDAGVVVSNVSTAKAVSDAIRKGMPLVERVVTVSGEKVEKPGNYLIKIGTMVKDIADYCGIRQLDTLQVKLGGPMMGIPLSDINVPVIKGSNGIIVVEEDCAEEQPCIKCGRCVDVCPMELMPLYFSKYLEEKNWQGLKDKNIMECIECRCCEYICSSRIPLVAKIKTGKSVLREKK